MIRHGRPAASWGEADQDPGLDETGHDQARKVAAALMQMPPSERPSFVVSSPLNRCRQTAQPLADALGVEVIIDPRIGEIPTPKALSPAQRPAWLKAAFAGLWRDMVGDLDYEVWRSQVSAAVADYPGGAVFSHYVAINAAVSVCRGDDRVLSCQPDHTAVMSFDIDGGVLTLVSLGQQASTQVL